MKPIWVLINCNSVREAHKIGDKVLDKRLGSCFDIFERNITSYFWPPKSGKRQTAKGSLLVVETFEEKYREIQAFIKGIHSDELPFIGYIEIKGIEDNYNKWIKDDLR